MIKEKIKERRMLLLWLPKVLVIPATLFAALFMLLFMRVPAVGIVVGSAIIAAPVIFSLIYDFCFYYQLSLDVNAVCEGDGLESTSYLYVFVFNTLTLGLYGKFWIYKIAQRLKANAPRYDFKMMVGGKEMVVLDIFSYGWISKWEFVKNMNKFAKVFNQQGLPKFEGGAQ